MANYKALEQSGADSQVHASVHDAALKPSVEGEKVLNSGNELGGRRGDPIGLPEGLKSLFVTLEDRGQLLLQTKLTPQE
jgi:hypothetical protein